MAAGSVDFRLRLLGGWGLRRGESQVALQLREQRVVALLGLLGPQPRSTMVGLLWPESPEDRARSNLRTALLRIRRVLDGAVEIGRHEVRLAGTVTIDVTLLRSVLDMVEAEPDEIAADPVAVLRVLRAPELLAGWYDEWVVEERERLRHRTFRALERLATVSLENGRPGDGIGYAEEAVRLEPLVESATSLHIRALLGDGDLSAAVSEYRRFRARIRAELDLGPPRALTELLLAAKAERSEPPSGLALDPVTEQRRR